MKIFRNIIWWFDKKKIAVLTEAIKNKNIIQFRYSGYIRLVEPHIIGVLEESNRNVLFGWVVGGDSERDYAQQSIRWHTYQIRKIKNIIISDEHIKHKRDCGEVFFKEIFCKIPE